MSINIGHLYRKKTVRKLDGSIYEMVDEANGGTLISRGRVVNHDRINELAKIEEDKRSSATIATQVGVPQHIIDQRMGIKSAEPIPEPVKQEPTKIEVLEKEVSDMKGNIEAILNILKNK